jgi:anthranilate phosphoribosyltransferase
MHPFARFIQILAKGRNGMRSLTQDEAYEAMQMIARYDVEPEQLGAFLMLMRVKEETAEEVAGFTLALRESLPTANFNVRPAIDWAAYAGKKRHLPWFVLAALIVSAQGYPVFMHGMHREDERVYAPEALQVLGIEIAESIQSAETQLNQYGFSYLPIDKLSPLTAELIHTRELFGLRPPLHTVARMLNPFAAPLTIMGVFHPNYSYIHQHAARLLQQPNGLICKGEGGEFERIPDRSLELYGLTKNETWTESWGNLLKPGQEIKPDQLDLQHFKQVWLGEAEDSYADAAVSGTLALVIRSLGIETRASQAQQLAELWWRERHVAEPSRAAGS